MADLPFQFRCEIPDAVYATLDVLQVTVAGGVRLHKVAVSGALVAARITAGRFVHKSLMSGPLIGPPTRLQGGFT